MASKSKVDADTTTQKVTAHSALVRAIAIGGAVDLLLVVLKGCTPSCFPFLPLGGDGLSQIGATLGISVVVSVFWDEFKAK